MIFAAKTTASGLIALLVAFTFNLDQPQWVLLTVFIVAQPQSGLVLAKSFNRIIGTLIGAAVALTFVALFAQERVLFLGSLALWIGVCTFGSQYARNFAAYSFVLSGYTVAIVGIPGALDAGNAFYIGTARVTEITLGIIVTAAVSHVVFPSSLAASLWHAVAEVRLALADYVLAILGNGDAAALRAKVMSQAIAIENLRASAIFEHREVRDRNSGLRRLNAALINVIGAAQPIGAQLENLRRTDKLIEGGMKDALAGAAAAVGTWRAGGIDAARLRADLLEACARSSSTQLQELFAALAAYAAANEASASNKGRTPRDIGFTHANDPVAALWMGVRAVLGVVVVSCFWILSGWPHGSTAAILAAVATARLATMGHAVPISIAAIFIFALATIPAFVVVEVLMPLASGFEMFALLVAPVIFCCALLMAQKKTELQLIGFFSGLLFASVGQFQDRMAYDPVGLLNTSIAAVFAAGTALVLWSVFAPETSQAARHRFLRVARQAQQRIAGSRLRMGLAEFETAMTDALVQWQSHLRADRPDDVAAFELGIALLGTGRELIRSEKGRGAAGEDKSLEFAANEEPKTFERGAVAATGHHERTRSDAA